MGGCNYLRVKMGRVRGGFLLGILTLIFLKVAAQASSLHYLVTNDDVSDNYVQNTVTFYTIGANGELTLAQSVDVGVTGANGGYFPSTRVVALNTSSNQCIFASDAATGEIAGVDVNTLALTGSAKGSSTDTGLSNGVGLALNSQYLYAGFSDSNTIGTFEILGNCSLGFVGDVAVAGLQGGVVDGMAVHGNMLIATYGDGSIESFNLSSGLPISNDDEQNSTGSKAGNSYPSGIDITQDGHFAIFGDTSTATLIEVSDISSGKLTPTITYKFGSGINSSNVMLSPDESLLYISNTQGDEISAAFFNKTTGQLSSGCVSNRIRGYSSSWSYLASLALASTSGDGAAVYVAEFASPSSIAEIQVNSSSGQCSMAEMPTSPVADSNSFGLLSIAAFPPRAF